MKANRLWSLWQGILLSFSMGFTQRGQQRFVEWATGLALNIEEHTITQSPIGLDRVDDWKALESFAESGSRNVRSIEKRRACDESQALQEWRRRELNPGPVALPCRHLRV